LFNGHLFLLLNRILPFSARFAISEKKMSTFVYAYTRFIALKQPLKALTEEKTYHYCRTDGFSFWQFKINVFHGI